MIPRRANGGKPVKCRPTSFDSLFSIAHFDITKSNVLTPDPAKTSFEIATSEVTSRGLKVKGQFWLGNSWDVVGPYTYPDAEISKTSCGRQLGKHPYLVPEHQASVWLNHTVQSGNLEGPSLDGWLHYVGNSFGDDANTVRVLGRTVVDAGVSYTYKVATLLLNTKNLFKMQWYTTCEDKYSC